jgi:hypothetical protein
MFKSVSAITGSSDSYHHSLTHSATVQWCANNIVSLCRDMSQLEQNEIIRDVFRTLCYSEHGHTRCFIKMPGALMLDQVQCSLLQAMCAIV